jgi:hypothetical protein
MLNTTDFYSALRAEVNRMRNKKMKFYLLLSAIVLLVFPAIVAGQDSVNKQTVRLPLGESVFKINVYEKAGAGVTFFAPHHNEQIAVKTAKEVVGQRGGRLVEIESFASNGSPARHLAFKSGGKSYAVDPNRIFTRNGRRCAGFSGEIERAVENFADELLKIIFPAGGGNSLPSGENSSSPFTTTRTLTTKRRAENPPI